MFRPTVVKENVPPGPYRCRFPAGGRHRKVAKAHGTLRKNFPLEWLSIDANNDDARMFRPTIPLQVPGSRSSKRRTVMIRHQSPRITEEEPSRSKSWKCYRLGPSECSARPYRCRFPAGGRPRERYCFCTKLSRLTEEDAGTLNALAMSQERLILRIQCRCYI